MKLIRRLQIGFGQMNLVVHFIVFFQETRKVQIADLELVYGIHLTRKFIGKGVGRIGHVPLLRLLDVRDLFYHKTCHGFALCQGR